MEFLWKQLFWALGPAFVSSARAAASAADDLAGSPEDPYRHRDQAFELQVRLRRLGGSGAPGGADDTGDAAEATVTLSAEILRGVWNALLALAAERRWWPETP